MTEPSDVLRYWFGDGSQSSGEVMKTNLARWFRGGPEIDREIRERFGADVEAAIDGGRDGWIAQGIRGRLALVLLLDQFTRGIFRDDPRTYAGDARAQRLAIDALDAGMERELRVEERMFLTTPLTHAEDLVLQERNVAEMRRLADEAGADPDVQRVLGMGVEQSVKYRDIIARFGRFPHRNAIHGRTSTPEELAFLADWAQKMAPRGAPQPKA